MKLERTGTQDMAYDRSARTDRQAEAGNTAQHTKEAAKESSQIKNGTIFAGNLNLIEDPIAKRREEARKEAMGLISSQFQMDSDIDADMVKRSEHIDEEREEGRHAGEEIARLEEEMERMKTEYGVEDGSEELLQIQEEIKHWKKQQAESESAIRGEVAAVRATKQALLERTHDMTDAAAAAEDIMDAASEEIIGMLTKEAVDKMEEDRKEELIEDRREQEKIEELTKQAIEADSTLDPDEVRRKIQEILNEQKLLEDDLKGIAVDART